MKPSHPQGISAAGAPPGPRSKRRAASGNSAPARPRDARSSRRAATLAMIEQVQPTADHERNQHCAFQVHRREDHAREGSQVVIIARTAANKSAAIAVTRSMLYDAEPDPHPPLRATAPRERKKEKVPRSLAGLCLSSSLQGEGFCCPGLRSKRREQGRFAPPRSPG